jgi:hypothetical protein
MPFKWHARENEITGDNLMDQQALGLILQQHGIETDSLTPLATFADETAYRLAVQGTEAVHLWQRLRRLVEVTGQWPILLWSYQKWEDVANLGMKTSHPQEIIEEGLRIDVENWMRQRVESYVSDVGGNHLHGAWPDEIPPIASTTTSSMVSLALLPTKEGWHVPAYLNFGSWNDCPSPQVQVCMMKRWHDHYGAELMGMAGAQVEMWVPRPPQERVSALQLACEQFAYCYELLGYDLVTETLEDLAARLLNSPWWHFWWD